MPYTPVTRVKRSQSNDNNINIIPNDNDLINSDSISPYQSNNELSSIGRQLSDLNIDYQNNNQLDNSIDNDDDDDNDESKNCLTKNTNLTLGKDNNNTKIGYNKFNSISDDDSLPLSLSFLKKPSRSSSMDSGIDIQKIIKQNTLINSKKFDNYNYNNSNIDTTIESPESPVSPLVSISNINLDTSNNIDNENNYHYPLVRKKSGELVKSSLKLNSSFKSSGAVSMPTTPTYKQVHFGNNINVKYFKEKDKPNSISADNSPFNSETEQLHDEDDDDYYSDENIKLRSDSDDEYDDDDYDDDTIRSNNINYFGFTNNVVLDSNYYHDKLFKSCKKYIESENPRKLEKFKNAIKNWNLDLSDFQTISYRDKIDCEVPVFLERVFLNLDKTLIIGQIAVKNLSFTKSVKIRYTVDNWKTIINVIAKYTSDIPRVLKKAGYDRFIFQLSTPILLTSYFKSNPTSFNINPIINFCVKFSCNGQDYWDNNNRKNYTLKFFNTKMLNNNNTEQYLSSPTPSKSKENLIINKDKNQTKKGDNSYFPKSINNSNVKIKRSRSFDMRNNIKAMISSPKFLIKDNNGDKNPTSISLTDTKDNIPSLNINIPDDKNNQYYQEYDTISGNSTLQDNKINKINENNNITENNNGKQNLREVFINSKDSTPKGIDNNQLIGNGDNSIESESYKDLLEKYCFFKGPNPVSSFLTDVKDPTDGSSVYTEKFY